ncbi:hypothetical protein LY76DRAFT_591603 [Colletotrichum caudatum]|nr:hypothetical protein LY76DRAFT_591603 [Colletotrichum caudatum]
MSCPREGLSFAVYLARACVLCGSNEPNWGFDESSGRCLVCGCGTLMLTGGRQQTAKAPTKQPTNQATQFLRKGGRR